MIELARQFVPAADEVWRLQRGTDPECRFFQSFADTGHYRGAGGTRQGIYVCTAGGQMLASMNSLNADTVLATLESSLADWRALPPCQQRLPTASAFKPAHRWEDSFPDDGLVLKSYSRDLQPHATPAQNRSPHWNTDHVWFTREEARGWLPDNPKKGAVHEVPEVITHRLVRYHLVDNARGQTLPFAPQEIENARLTTEVLSRAGDKVELRLTGVTSAAADGPWLLGDNDWTPPQDYPRSIRTTMLGSASYDLGRERFTEFETIALGSWKGYTQNNGRRRGPQQGRIGFYFTLAPDEPAERIGPGFVSIYDAQWIKSPAGPVLSEE